MDFIISLVTVILTLALFTFLIWMVTPDGYAQKYPYKATLNAQNEVPPGESIANGQAEFTKRANGNIKYRVNITGINSGNAVAAHIHTGADGQNGDVVADLLYTPTSQIRHCLWDDIQGNYR